MGTQTVRMLNMDSPIVVSLLADISMSENEINKGTNSASTRSPSIDFDLVLEECKGNNNKKKVKKRNPSLSQSFTKDASNIIAAVLPTDEDTDRTLDIDLILKEHDEHKSTEKISKKQPKN